MGSHVCPVSLQGPKVLPTSFAEVAFPGALLKDSGIRTGAPTCLRLEHARATPEVKSKA